MNVQSLVFSLVLSFLMVGCDFGMDKAYLEMVEVIEANNSILETSIKSKISSIENVVKRKPDYKALVPAAREIQSVTLDFIKFLNEVNSHFDNKKFDKIDSNKIKEKAITVKQKTIEKMNSLIGNRTLGIKKAEIEELTVKHIFPNGNLPKINGENWEDYNFQRQSIETNKSALTNLENDALIVAKQAIDFLESKVGSTIICGWDPFMVLSSPKKNFIIKGETFETEIFLYLPSSFRMQASTSTKVNGKEIPTKNGVATYKNKPTRYGEHAYTVEITIVNEHNDKSETYKKTFKYEVGERCY